MPPVIPSAMPLTMLSPISPQLIPPMASIISPGRPANQSSIALPSSPSFSRTNGIASLRSQFPNFPPSSTAFSPSHPRNFKNKSTPSVHIQFQISPAALVSIGIPSDSIQEANADTISANLSPSQPIN